MYRYEMHLHTSEGSACASSSGSEYPAIFKERGYDGVFITDHFYHGCTFPSTDLPWPDYVNEYCKGYEAAKKAGDEIGFKVFFGIEEEFGVDEYLIYGLDKEFLIAHPEIQHWTREEMIALVHGAGGAVMQAHPFRDRDYVPMIWVHPEGIDGIEGINTANHSMDDLAALCCAHRYGLRIVAGSDTHNISNITERNGGIITERPIESPEDLVRIIRDREPLGVFYPEGYFSDIEKFGVRLKVKIFRNGAWEMLDPSELEEWYLSAAAGLDKPSEVAGKILRDLGQQ
ncbi:MAG: hypothetical protein J5933_00820 [Clostridia bacterium]|nr:hypothetical protein [Clostridia bacterium]